MVTIDTLLQQHDACGQQLNKQQLKHVVACALEQQFPSASGWQEARSSFPWVPATACVPPPHLNGNDKT